MKLNGKLRLFDHSKPGRKRMYLTHEAKGHQIPVALGNTGNGGIQFHRGDQLLPTGLEVPLGANLTGVRATGDGAVVLQLTERVELRHGPLGGLGGPHGQQKFTHGGGGQ